MQPRKAWGNFNNVTLESLGKLWRYNLGTLETPWEPWGNLYNTTVGTLENLGTLKKPWGYLLGTLRERWQSNLGNLIETFTMSPWGPGPQLLWNLYLGTWEPWQPLLGKLGNLAGNLEEPFGNIGEPYLGTLTWEPGNLYVERGNLGGMRFGAAPVCSETFTMAEDPKEFCCWGIKII